MPPTSKSSELHQSRVVGWYAVQRVRIADWLKPRQGKEREILSSAVATDEALNETPDQAAESADNKASDAKANKSETEKPMQEEATTSNSKKSKERSEKNSKSQDKPEVPERPVPNSEDAQKLKAVVRESHTILAHAHSVFPFQLFPDSVNIDRHKLTILRRQFFGVEQKVSVPLENVRNIEADLGPFFGSITITSDLFINNTQKVHFLWRDDAKKIQKLVQGAVVAQGNGIDLNKIDIKQLRSLLIDLGSGHTKSV